MIAPHVAAEATKRKTPHIIVQANTPYDIDETLENLEVRTINCDRSITCERFYELSQEIVDIHLALEPLVAPFDGSSEQPMTMEAIIQFTKRRSDEASQALDAVMSAMKLHKRVCADAHAQLFS
ncbi:unnamed protein product [Phytophthora lilii]|uniref:Unnamed protein product n=1 Tax=Phytophthora lilii TaxID=2077276 RepID=A0A9W7CSK5_9STRA|nr:unnamed protein product [Phytophthora lilii]